MKNYNKGILGQISTGEGKTIIIAMLAIFKSLQGYSVNIITSSKVLAERDSNDNDKLFELFYLTSFNNCDEEA